MSDTKYRESPGCAACALSASAADIVAGAEPPAQDVGIGDEMAQLLTSGGKMIPADSPKLNGDNGPMIGWSFAAPR